MLSILFGTEYDLHVQCVFIALTLYTKNMIWARNGEKINKKIRAVLLKIYFLNV